MKNTLVYEKLIIASAVIGAGVGFNGMFVFDEIALIAVTSALLLRHKLSISRQAINTNIVELTFLAFLLISATVSMITLNIEFLSKMRYVLVFLFLFFYFLSKKSSSKWKEETGFTTFAIKLLALYFVCTLVQGFLLEVIVGSYSYSGSSGTFYDDIQGRYFSQGNFWVGSAYFSIATLYLLYLLSITRSSATPYIFSLIFIVALYFDSRVMLIMLLLFFPLMINFSTRKISRVFMAILFFSGFSVFLIGNYESITVIIGSAIDTIQFQPRASDEDRVAHLKAAFYAFEDRPWLLFSGAYWQGHKVELVSILNSPNSIVRSNGITALIVDTGIIGVTLFLILICRIAYRTISSVESKFRGVYLSVVYTFSLVSIFFVTYPWESVLLWLMLFGVELDKSIRISSSSRFERQ